MDSQPKPEEANHLENMSRAMNVARDWVLTALSLVLYFVTRQLVVALQKFTWAVWGVERVRRDARRGLQFKQSAHVQEIMWRRKTSACAVADERDFITKHKGFRHPSCVLRPNVSLYCLTKTEAVFVETGEADDVYHAGGPLYQRQFQLAQNVIAMPLASFHKTAQDVASPRVPLTWLSSTPRAGAALLAHVLGVGPTTRVLYEPDVLTSLGAMLRDGSLPASEYSQLLGSAVGLLCKPDERCGALLIKVRPGLTRMMEDVHRAFPRARFLFLYRNSLKTLHSCLALASNDPASKALRFVLDSRALSALFPCARRRVFAAVADVDEKSSVELRDRGVPVRTVLYEDVMRSPRAACQELFKLLGLLPQYVPQALQVFSSDYNRSAASTQQPYADDSRRALPAEARHEADAILKKHGLPKLGERVELSGLVKFE